MSEQQDYGIEEKYYMLRDAEKKMTIGKEQIFDIGGMIIGQLI